MSIPVTGDYAASKIQQNIPNSVVSSDVTNVWIKAENLVDVFSYLKDDAELDMQFLNSISAVDYIEYFELVYHMQSINHNHSLVIKSRCWGREGHTVPSVVDIWRGADFQEREIYDLMGISFTNHPNLKRIMLWEGFPGHPQRKDYFEPPR